GCHPFNVEFENESDNADNYYWDFKDGVTSNLEDPQNRFENTTTSDKDFEVLLHATSEFDCEDSITQPVTVYPSPNVAFAVTPTLQIYPNATVSLDNNTNNLTTGPWDYEWDFGDGETSTDVQPGEHTYDTWGEYEITLEAESAECYDSVSHNITIIPPEPVADFTTDPVEGCQPLTVQFEDNSLYADDYHWDFDDGDTSKAESPEHTFTEAGTYYIKQSISGEGGDDYAYQTVNVFRKPIADFKVEPKLVMLPDEEVACYSLSKHEDKWEWDFGDGGEANIESPKHLYRDTGKYDIRLEVSTHKECRDTIVKEDVVHVIGQGQIEFPNAFTPSKSGPTGGGWKEGEDADGLNDIFHPLGEGVIEYKLEIFNKWGEKIYESNDFHKG
ncbi:MAG: PKD domain-containing protein, partial [Bacteroidota bacterium]